MALDNEWNSAFLRELSGDVGAASEQLRASPDSQVTRRSYIRSLFSMIEGITNYLKTLALRAGESNRNLFTPAETALLREESYAIDNKGEAYVQPRFIKIEDNLVFALRMYLRDKPVPLEIERDGVGWNAFREAIVIRNRITHPRSLDDLSVKDSEVGKIRQAEHWFHFTVISNLLEAAFRLRELAGENADA
jgi:hypothetical protein